MSDSRPSIAELQAAHECVREGCWTDASDRLIKAVPLLLGIVAAAMAWRDAADCHDYDATMEAIATIRVSLAELRR